MSFAFGTSFPTVGPGISALNRCIVLSGEDGIIAMINTSTPIPPTQCVKLRQNKTLLLNASTFVKTDEPVVVKPLTVSKNAST